MRPRVLLLGGPRDEDDCLEADDLLVGWCGDPARWQVLHRGDLERGGREALSRFLSEGKGLHFWSVALCPRSMSSSAVDRELARMTRAPDVGVPS